MAHKDIIGDVIVKINSKILEPAELKKLDKLEKEQIHGQASTNKGKVESTTKQCLSNFKKCFLASRITFNPVKHIMHVQIRSLQACVMQTAAWGMAKLGKRSLLTMKSRVRIPTELNNTMQLINI